MTQPDIDYSRRAGNQPRPGDWREPLRVVEYTRERWESFLGGHPELANTLGTTGITFFCDISEFQPVVTSRYPYPMIGFRADTGWRLDNNAVANWTYIRKNPTHILVAPMYVVFIPGESDAIFKRLQNTWGSQCPPPICPMVDMESGSGFAGPGNHSAEANDLVSRLAAWSGRGGATAGRARQLGYANGWDWSSNWPNPLRWMKKTLARYDGASGVPSGYYARQYAGGLKTGIPYGYPSSVPPFGSYVDLNVIEHDITTIVNDFGLDWFSMATVDDLRTVVQQELANFKTPPPTGDVSVGGLLSYDHSTHGSIEAYLTGIPGYQTLKSRRTKKVTLDSGAELEVPIDENGTSD